MSTSWHIQPDPAPRKKDPTNITKSDTMNETTCFYYILKAVVLHLILPDTTVFIREPFIRFNDSIRGTDYIANPFFLN